MPGGSGHVGAAIRRWLEPKGWTFTVLTRRPSKSDEVEWDGRTLDAWSDAIDGCDLVINLAGRSVNCRYNRRNLDEMMDSRVDSTRVIGEAIAAAKNPPRLWLQASTATIYRQRFDAPNDDLRGELGGDEPGTPYKWKASIAIAKAWEAELEKAHTPKTRKVAMRSSITMSIDKGSVFDVLATLARRGLGGAAGNGTQYVSWVHEEDFACSLEFLVEHEELSGPVNICSPNPLPNAEFMRILRQAVGARWALPQPRWLLEIGAAVLGTETELVLKSRRVVPRRLLDAGFKFMHPHWSEAARELTSRRP